MAKLCVCSSLMTPSKLTFHTDSCHPYIFNVQHKTLRTSVTVFASKPGGFSIKSIGKRCQKCNDQGAIECPGCKGTGRNKKNGNIFERWKCFDCQGFGMKSCPECGKGGLTPEQRGER